MNPKIIKYLKEEKMIHTYTPFRGMIICIEGGEYVKTSDYLSEIAKKDQVLLLAKIALEFYHPVMNEKEPCVAFEAWIKIKEILKGVN